MTGLLMEIVVVVGRLIEEAVDEVSVLELGRDIQKLQLFTGVSNFSLDIWVNFISVPIKLN
jgi:hypothetical protein